MKKVMTVVLTVFGLLALTSLAYAAAPTGIAATKHNLSTGASTISGDFAEICVYCHTPHGGKKALVDDTGPLWNRNAPAGSFDVYESRTLDSIPGQPTSVSKACLSCHDGTISINALLNQPGPGSGTGTGTDKRIGNVTGTNNLALIGTDLRDDHPVSMIYQDAKSYGTGAAIGTDSHAAGFNAANTVGNKHGVTVGSVTLPLYGAALASAKVECASCHDPHEERSKTQAADQTKAVFFLRMVNDGSALCVTCHKK